VEEKPGSDEEETPEREIYQDLYRVIERMD
jgi:hypothetical protein